MAASPHRPVDIIGICAADYGGVKDAFASNFEKNREVGACVAVAVDGELVVDIWGGHRDAGRTVPWERDTIVNVWSTTKTMTNLCALVLASRGRLELDAPVVTYWPEFAAAGKQTVLVRHLLAHTAGLPAWDTRLTASDLFDWDRVTGLLAAQAPWWEPGTRSGYHGLTQGNLVGEVIRRVDGRSVGQFFADEIARPLGADFFIRLPPAEDARVARVIPGPPLQYRDVEGRPAPRDSIPARAQNPPLTPEDSWSEEWRRAEIPAAGGHGNARGVAIVQSVVSAGGSARGISLLTPEVVDRIFDVQAAGRDLVLGMGVTFGIGYAINSTRKPIAPNPRVCYWGGWGGSLIVNDLDARMTMTYVMNRMGEGTVGDERSHSVLAAVYRALDGKTGRR